MKTAAIILAAGFSSRMGAYKPALPVGGESALSRAVSFTLKAGAARIIVVTGYGKIGDALGASLSSVDLVYNERYSEGMFTSVLKGVSSLPGDTDVFFLLPADCAACSPVTLRALLVACGELSTPAVCHPVFEGSRGHPPLIPISFMEGIASYDGREGLRGWLGRFKSVDVPVTDPGVLMDMDTPEDYAALLRYLGLPTYPDDKGAAALLDKYGASDGIRLHGQQVAALADRIASGLLPGGPRLDRKLLRAAALLHDLTRGQPNHAQYGANLLLAEGYPDAAGLVRTHMDLPEGSVIDEASVLFLADKLSRRGAARRPEDTLRELELRFSGDEEAIGAARRRLGLASRLLELLRARYGVTFEEM